MRRIDRYWKRCAAGVMAALTLMLGQGTMQSFAMNAKVVTSPNKIIVQDETQNVMDLNVVYDDASGMLTVLLPVTKKTTSDVAVVYAQDVLGTIGEAVSTQNFYFTAPEENEDGYTTDYGSFFDEHDVKVQVFPYDKEGDESAYLVNDTIKAGDVRAVEPLQ